MKIIWKQDYKDDDYKWVDILGNKVSLPETFTAEIDGYEHKVQHRLIRTSDDNDQGSYVVKIPEAYRTRAPAHYIPNLKWEHYHITISTEIVQDEQR